MKLNFLLATLFGVAVLGVSCSKDDKDDPQPNPTPTQTYGDFSIEMEYVFGHSEVPFALNELLVHPMTGDSLTFTKFRHYISNIKLKRSNNTYWKDKESYYILDASDANSLHLHFNNVPSGDYVAMEITFGVDSARNVSGAQTGALDPANQMFWSWSSGYIMIKAEGLCPQSSSGNYEYHLGGFSGPDKAVMVREMAFPGGAVMTISPNASPEIHMIANPARLFHTYGSVMGGAMIHMPGPDAGTMSRDFNSNVRIDHLHM